MVLPLEGEVIGILFVECSKADRPSRPPGGIRKAAVMGWAVNNRTGDGRQGV